MQQPATTTRRTARFSSVTRAAIFESLEFRDFRWIWLGAFASFMAMNMQMITRSWLVLRLTDDSPLKMALVMMSFALPMTFVSLIGGALADRIPRKHMIILSQSGAIVLTLVLATLDLTGVVTFEHVLVIGLFNGSLMAFQMPSRMAIISDIVPESKLMNAISLANSGMNLTRIAGPALAGGLILVIGTWGVFYLVSGIYVFSVLTMFRVNAGKTPATNSRKSMTGDIREGLSYVASDPTRLGLVIMAFIPVLFGMSYYALLPAWAREALNVRSDGLGMLLMIMGIGALVGTVVLAALSKMKRRGAFLLVVCVFWGVALAIFARTTSYWVAVPFLMFIGLGSSLFMSLNMTLMQSHASPEMRGRVMSISMMTYGAMPLSALPFGAIAEVIKTSNALLISGVLLAVFTLVFTIVYPSFRRIE